jgi:integrase
MSKPKFPVTVKRGHTTVKIYRTPSRGCDAYTVSYYLGDQRVRKTFADYGLATTEAETVANKLSTGEVNVLTLTSGDRLSYIRAIEALKPTGVPLEMAAIQFAEAHKILEGGSVVEAARFSAKKNPVWLPKKGVPEVVTEMIEAKTTDGMSKYYTSDLKWRLGRFAEKFPGVISLVTSAEIGDFLRGLKGEPDENGKALPVTGRSRNNFRRAIGTLINFAVSRGYLVKGTVEIEDVAQAREDKGEIEIFRPEEMAAVLKIADERLIPFLAIGAFAGLRHAELQRLDWAEVRMDDGFIEVKANKAKTASRRLVPIQANLKRWLKPYRKASGHICDYVNTSNQIDKLAELVDQKLKEKDSTAAFTWKRNALRHSYISYRVAETQDVAKVSLEAGNSPQMIFQHYRELVRPEAAKAWFSIKPETLKN